MRALEELRLVKGNIAVEDLRTFTGTLIKEMGLMIGSEESLRGRFDVINQLDFYDWEGQRETAAHLSEKIIQAQQNMAKNDRDFPF